MTKITTKRGDQGLTDLYGALEVPKHHFLIQIIGALDELQTVIGLLKVELKKGQLLAELEAVQKSLYNIMGFLANSNAKKSQEIALFLEQLENQSQYWQTKTKIKNQFVIPGNNRAETQAHLCRVKVRSVERLLSQFNYKSTKIKPLLPVINRMSDYFFAVSQYLNK